MAISSLGVGSNLDLNGIITKLMQVEAQPLTALAQREASFQAKMSAYGSIKGALSSFQSAVQSLLDPAKFLSLKASSSDSTVAATTASSSAVAGNYALNVSKVAQSQSLLAAGQASTTAVIGSGTITIDFGTISGGTFTAYDAVAGTGGSYSGAGFASNGSGAKTITIDASNNSLAGIRDAINAADIGVTATIINDGGTSPYRLVLSSEVAGKSNSLKISVSGDAALSNLLAHDPTGTQNMKETITGQNTELTVNGVFVSKPSTSLADVIQGVTLNVLKAGTTTVSVTKDGSATSSAVSTFVKAYNDLNKTLKDLTAYNVETKQAAVLQGDSAVRTIQSQLRGLLGSSLSPAGAYSLLSQVGLTFQKDGTLSLDSNKLQNALSANPSAVAQLFAATGSASDSLVSYAGSTDKTKPGSYALSITQIATQGKLVGSGAVGFPYTVTAGVNDALSVTVDGVTASVTLSAASYTTAAALAAEVQSKINGATAFSDAGISVAVSEVANVLTITSNRYGSASNVSVSGTGSAGLLGAGPTATAGVDVTGTIGGATASGAGQNLTGATGGDTEGLKLQIAGGVSGDRGTVNFYQGFAYRLNKLLDDMVSSTGTLSSRTDGINRSIKDIANRRDALSRRLFDVEARYRKQFAALDTLISNMNQTSAYLQQQLANLPKVGG